MGRRYPLSHWVWLLEGLASASFSALRPLRGASLSGSCALPGPPSRESRGALVESSLSIQVSPAPASGRPEEREDQCHPFDPGFQKKVAVRKNKGKHPCQGNFSPRRLQAGSRKPQTGLWFVNLHVDLGTEDSSKTLTCFQRGSWAPSKIHQGGVHLATHTAPDSLAS